MLADSRPARWRAAVVALAALYYLAPWHSLGAAAAWFGPPVVFLFVVFMPGAAVARRSGVTPRDRLEELSWYSILGLFAALVACFVWALWGAPLGLVRWGYPALAAVLAWTAPTPDRHRLPLDRLRVSGGARRAMFALVAFVAVVGAIVWVSGPPTHFSSDTIDHAAYVREVARTGDPFPTTAFYKDAGADGEDLRKSLMHALMGAWTRHLGINPIALFAFLGGLQLVILTVTVYAAANRLFGSRAVAVMSALAFALVFDGGVGGKVVRTMFYPNRFGIAPLLLFVSAAMGYLARPSRRVLALCAILGFTAAAVHLQYVVFVALAAGIIVVWKTCSPCGTWRVHLRRSLAVAVTAGLAVLPYVVFRVVTGYQTNDLHKEVQGAMFVGGGLYVVDPFIVWDWLEWMGLAALVAVVPLWRHRRAVPGLGFAIASLLSALFLMLNPLVTPIAFDALSYLVHRLGRFVPIYMVAGFLLVSAMGLERRYPSVRPWRAWRRVAVALAFVAVAIGAWNVVANRHVMLASSEREARVSLARWADDIAAVTAGLPAGAVVASDPVTSYYLSAVTPVYVLCTLDQHAPPNDRRADQRMAAARDILSPFTSPVEKTELVDAWGVTHVLVNTDLPDGLVLKYWTLDPDVAIRAEQELRDLDGAFDLVASSGSLHLFARGRLRARRTGTTTPVVTTLPGKAKPIGEVAGEATLVAARVGKLHIEPGEDLDVDLYWKRAQPAAPGNYVVTLRFDHANPGLPLDGKPFAKIARKVKERLDGVHYRFRDGHIFQRGFFGPDRWPAGAIVYDPTTIRIPRGLAPGWWTVQALLVRVPPIPNTDLRSYFFDDDMYSGVEIGTIAIGVNAE